MHGRARKWIRWDSRRCHRASTHAGRSSEKRRADSAQHAQNGQPCALAAPLAAWLHVAAPLRHYALDYGDGSDVPHPGLPAWLRLVHMALGMAGAAAVASTAVVARRLSRRCSRTAAAEATDASDELVFPAVLATACVLSVLLSPWPLQALDDAIGYRA